MLLNKGSIQSIQSESSVLKAIFFSKKLELCFTTLVSAFLFSVKTVILCSWENISSCRKPETSKTSSPAEEDLEEGVYSTLLSPDHYSELKDDTSAKPVGDATSLLMATSSSRGGKSNYLTMTGTMRKKRREVSVYDVQGRYLVLP